MCAPMHECMHIWIHTFVCMCIYFWPCMHFSISVYVRAYGTQVSNTCVSYKMPRLSQLAVWTCMDTRWFLHKTATCVRVCVSVGGGDICTRQLQLRCTPTGGILSRTHAQIYACMPLYTNTKNNISHKYTYIHKKSLFSSCINMAYKVTSRYTTPPTACMFS